MTKLVHQIKASHGPPYPSFGVMFLVNVKKLWIACKIRISQEIIAMNRTFLQQSRICNVILTSLKTNNINLFTSSLFFGSFSDNFNFSMKKASRAYNFCFICKRHVLFNWQIVGHKKTKLNAQRYKKDWNKFIFLLYKCLKFLPSRFTVLVTHSITCIILPLSNIIICLKLSYPWKQTTE